MLHLSPTKSVRTFDDMEVSNISVEEIAKNLSLICRFNGACGRFYSVAEHSVLVSHLVPKYAQCAALMHDAGEAYYGDITRPVAEYIEDKRFFDMRAYVDDLITKRFKLRDWISKYRTEIEEADNLMLSVERNYFFNFPLPNNLAFCDGYDRIKKMIYCLTPEKAEAEFLKRFGNVQ